MIEAGEGAAATAVDVEEFRILAETADQRVSLITIAPAEAIPWHRHSAVDDIFVCVTGRLMVRTRDPDTRVELDPGETYTVPAGQAHVVTAAGAAHCRYLLVQSGGAYDYIPVTDGDSGE